MEGAYFKVGSSYINKMHEPEFLKTVEAHDILCVQETHCGPNDIPSQHLDKTYKSIPHCRGKSANNRYFGGMILLIKKTIREGVKVTSTDDPDILGITLKKDFFKLPEDTLVWFTYASPMTSPYTKGRDNVLTKLEALMAAHGKHQIIMGDLNGRTATEADYIQEEYEAHSPLQDITHYQLDTPLSRNNMDSQTTDARGKMILNICKNLQVRILNGRTAGDRWGVPTRYPVHKKEKPSVIDYGMCSGNILPRLNSFYDAYLLFYEAVPAKKLPVSDTPEEGGPHHVNWVEDKGPKLDVDILLMMSMRYWETGGRCATPTEDNCKPEGL